MFDIKFVKRDSGKFLLNQIDMEKRGVVEEGKSLCDFSRTKKAAYYDECGSAIADECHKHKLKKPKKIGSITIRSNGKN